MFKTLDIVPSSIRSDPQIQAACASLDIELAGIYDGIPAICFWPNVDTQVPPLLDLLAWEMHVDVWQGWEGDLTIEEKRNLINQSVEWHQHKGTKWAVEQMLKTIFTKAYVTEWYQYGGNPYFFKVVVEQQIGDPVKLQLLTDSINAVKNERSWMEGYEVSSQIPHNLWTVVIVLVLKTTYIPVATNH